MRVAALRGVVPVTLAALFALVSVPAAAQGTLAGRVRSAADARPLAEVEIRAEGPDTASTRSDASGSFRFPSLRPGTYQLSARAVGFRASRTTQTVETGAPHTWTPSLEPMAQALDQLVVTAARREQRLADAVTTVEVVNRADLDRSGASDLSSVLTEYTGIELQGGHPAGAGVMLQGIGSERVLILLDGQPLAGRLSGSFDLSRVPVGMVERVEVVKGAQSTLYGSEAMGGVVNIITRSPERTLPALGGSMSATAGQQGRRDAIGRLTLANGAWSASGDVARRSVETAPGIDATDGALAARVDGAMKLRWSPDTVRSAELSVLALDERQRWRTGTLFGFSDNVQLNARLGGAYQRGRHRIAPGISLSNYDHVARASTYSLPIAGDTGQRQLQRIVQGEVIYAGRLTDAFAIDAGVQLRIDEIETARVPGGLRSHRSLEPFVQFELAPWRALTLTPGARVTVSDQWGTQMTPRIAARAALTDRLTLRASVGDGFRAPDFKELFLFFQNTSAGYAVQGNPELRPERSRSTMLGLEWATLTGAVRAQFFQNDFDDFIETRIISAPEEAPVYEYQNRDNGFTRGAEVEVSGRLIPSGALRGELGWSLLETRDRTTDRALLGRPGQSARAALQVALPFLARGSVTAVHTGRTPMQRDAESGAISSWRDAFTRVDLRLTRALPSLGLEIVLGADNVFDQRPAEWAGFTGRHVYTSLSFTFNRTLQ